MEAYLDYKTEKFDWKSFRYLVGFEPRTIFLWNNGLTNYPRLFTEFLQQIPVALTQSVVPKAQYKQKYRIEA